MAVFVRHTSHCVGNVGVCSKYLLRDFNAIRFFVCDEAIVSLTRGAQATLADVGYVVMLLCSSSYLSGTCASKVLTQFILERRRSLGSLA